MFFTIVLISVLAATVSVTAAAAVPFTFNSGTPARASEVNANFQNLDQRVGNAVGAVQVLTVTNSGSSNSAAVSSALCPAGTLVTGVGCDCSSQSGSRNFGVLFFCNLGGNGGVAGCFPEGTTFDPNKPVPLASITVKCLGATQTDGDSLTPATSKSLAAKDELERSLSEVDAQAQTHETLLRSRTK